MPQSLSQLAPNASVEISPDNAQLRPDQAAKAMCIISIWSLIEAELTNVVSHCLKTDFLAVASMFNELKNSFTKLELIKSVIHSTQSEENINLFEAVDLTIQPSRKLRNKIAHHVWGICKDLPQHILLIDPKDLLIRGAKLDGHYADPSVCEASMPPQELWDYDKTKIIAYTDKCLLQAYKDAIEAQILVGRLLVVFSNLDPLCVEVREELLKHPRVKSNLLKVLKRKGSSIPSPQPQLSEC